MNRITRWNGKKWVLPQGAWREIAERLAAYENTGLEPEQIENLKTARDNDIPVFKLGDVFPVAIIVHDEAGNVPYVDPVNCCAYLYVSEIAANADNPEAMQEPGVNHLVIAIYRDHWHIAQVGGYTPERGMYTKSF
jgi:hypothetical protein